MADKREALRLADFLDDQYDPSHNLGEAADELRRLHAVNQELLEVLVSFTKSGYIKKQHPKRYAVAIAAIAKAEGEKT
jgi:hypothetical protein